MWRKSARIDKGASQTRDCCVARNATLRAGDPGSFGKLRTGKKRPPQDDNDIVSD